MAKKEKEKIVYRNIECDSMEEMYFLMWVFELKEAGYISDIERSPSFKITDGWVNEYTEKLKTKNKNKTQTILNPSEYTPDIVIKFKKNIDKFCWWKAGKKTNQPFIGMLGKVYIETKGTFDANNMTRLFIINQKIMYAKYGIFVNLIKIPDFFKNTFTPSEYLLTATGRERKLKFVPRTSEEYLKTLI